MNINCNEKKVQHFFLVNTGHVIKNHLSPHLARMYGIKLSTQVKYTRHQGKQESCIKIKASRNKGYTETEQHVHSHKRFNM